MTENLQTLNEFYSLDRITLSPMQFQDLIKKHVTTPAVALHPFLRLWLLLSEFMLTRPTRDAQQGSFVMAVALAALTVLWLPPRLQPVGRKCGDDILNAVALGRFRLRAVRLGGVAHEALLLLLWGSRGGDGR